LFDYVSKSINKMPRQTKNPAKGPGVYWQTPGGLFVAVVANRFDGAALERFHALGDFLVGGGLLENERIPTFVVPLKKRWRRLAAEVAVDALLIDVELSPDILRPLVSFIRHRASEQRVERQTLSSGHTVHARAAKFPLILAMI
jgi:hypothetical protein